MRRRRNVKIVATLGPASRDAATIRKLFEAGADVFRINMSHTDHAGLANYVSMIRQIEADLERPIGILADLQGPKLRVGAMAGGGVENDAIVIAGRRLRWSPGRRDSGVGVQIVSGRS